MLNEVRDQKVNRFRKKGERLYNSRLRRWPRLLKKYKFCQTDTEIRDVKILKPFYYH